MRRESRHHPVGMVLLSDWRLQSGMLSGMESVMNHLNPWAARAMLVVIVCLLALAPLAGCSYAGVGNVSIAPAGATVDGRGVMEPVLAGKFDSVLTRKDGDVYTFTAYQRVTSRKGFSQHYRNYKKDAPFINAELTVRVRRDGSVVGQPRLLLRQGDNILTEGSLDGPVTLTPRDGQLTIGGSKLPWRFDDPVSPKPQDVSFELQVYNVLDPAKPTPPLTPAATT